MKKTATALASVALRMGAGPWRAVDLSGLMVYQPTHGLMIRSALGINTDERLHIVRKATDEYVRYLQAEIASDPALAHELRAHHVVLTHVIGTRKTMSGAAVYYVK